MITIPKFRRRWLQYSLRSVLLLVLIVAVACSWFAVRMRKARRQREAVESIRSIWYDYQLDANGFAIRDPKPNGPEWLRRLLGDDFFNDVVQATVVSDADAEYLDQLPELQRLYLVQMTGPTVFSDGIVTDVGVKHVKTLDRLKMLSLSGTQVTDDGLEHVAALTQLEELDLSARGVTDAGLEHLAALTQLERLDLTGTGVTDSGLKRLGEWTQLKWLSLAWTNVTDAGLVHLKGLNRLTYLALTRTAVTDAGLHHLNGMTQLEALNLGATGVTSSGVTRLHQELPNCRIVWFERFGD